MTLARLQQLGTAAMCVVAALAAALGVRAGWPAWAAALVALAVLLGYTAVLGLEFILMRLVHRDDAAAPAPSVWQLLRAFGGEATAAARTFGWRQPFRSQRWPDRLPTPAARGPTRGVVLVHGYVCNRGLWNDWLARLTRDDQPFIAIDLAPVFGEIADCSGRVGEAVERMRRATGLAPVVVAHSMGGLVVRHWWSAAPVDAIARLVTIGTPHGGTWLARFGLSPNARQMRPDSAFLRELLAAEAAGGSADDRARRSTCFFGHCDNIVFPPSNATWAGADNRHVAATAHVALVADDAPWQELQRWLAQPASRVGSGAGTPMWPSAQR